MGPLAAQVASSSPDWLALAGGIGIGAILSAAINAVAVSMAGNAQRQHEKELRLLDHEHDRRLQALADQRARRDYRATRIYVNLQAVVGLLVLLKDRVQEFRLFPQSYKPDVVPELAAAIDQLRTMRAVVQLDSVTTALFDRAGDASRNYQGFMTALQNWTRLRDAHHDSLEESTKKVARLGDKLAALIQEVLDEARAALAAAEAPLE